MFTIGIETTPIGMFTTPFSRSFTKAIVMYLIAILHMQYASCVRIGNTQYHCSNMVGSTKCVHMRSEEPTRRIDVEFVQHHLDVFD